MGLKLKNFAIRDIDKGWKERRKRLESAKKRRVTVGVHEKDADKRKVEGHGEVNNVDIGTWAEYGSATEPSRSWLRSTIDTNKNKYGEMLRSLAIQIIDGKQTPQKAMAILGEAAKADMIATINAGIPPPNAPETIARKGSSKPLIDTGSFKQSINYVVKSGGGEGEND